MRFFPTLLLVLAAVSAWGATPPADDQRILDEVLAQKDLDFAHAAWLAGRASGLFDETVDPAAAAVQAQSLGWRKAGSGPAAAVTLADYSQILVRAFPLPTGLLYSLFPGPRYAYRDLVFLKVIPGTVDSGSTVSGEAALRYLQAAQDWLEARR